MSKNAVFTVVLFKPFTVSANPQVSLPVLIERKYLIVNYSIGIIFVPDKMLKTTGCSIIPVDTVIGSQPYFS